MLKVIYQKLLAAIDAWDVFAFAVALGELAAYVKGQWDGTSEAQRSASAVGQCPADVVAYMRDYCECGDEPTHAEHGLFGGNFDWQTFLLDLWTAFNKARK